MHRKVNTKKEQNAKRPFRNRGLDFWAEFRILNYRFYKPKFSARIQITLTSCTWGDFLLNSSIHERGTYYDSKCLNLMLHSDDTRGLGLVSFQAFFPPIKQEKSEWSNIYLSFDEEVLGP